MKRTVLIGGVIVVSLLVIGVVLWPSRVATQQPGADDQPGTRWSEAQIKQAAAIVRAGQVLNPKSWPNGAKMAVCLSFDIDNESGTLLRGNVLPVPLSAGEYGALAGLPHILDLLEAEGVPASFFIPAVSAMLHPDMLTQINRRHPTHEIGVHGWIHESPPTLGPGEEERLLKQAVEYLAKATGRRPIGYRAPGWALSRQTLGLLKKMGFLYDTSLMAMDAPYEPLVDGQPTGLVELSIDWIRDDAVYFGRTGALPSPELIFQTYRDEFDGVYREGTVFVLTLHPHVTGHWSRLVHLQRLIAYMKSKPGVWFATGEQIARYVKEHRQTS